MERAMSRRSGFMSAARALARAARESERQLRQRERKNARTLKLQERLVKQEYFQSRQEEVDEINADISERIEQLESILTNALEANCTIDFNSLKTKLSLPKFTPSCSFERNPPGYPNWLVRLLWPGSINRYETACEQYKLAKQEFEKQIQIEHNKYEKHIQSLKDKAQLQNTEVDEFKTAYFAKTPDAVGAYNILVLEASQYPDQFLQEFRVAYVAESKEIVIDYRLPTSEIVPSEESVHYVKTKDEITSKPKKQKEIKELYRDVVAAISLRTIYEVLQADQAGAIDVVTFNGFVKTRDPSTGKEIQPYLLSTRVTKDSFNQLDLHYVQKAVCLRNLGARVSANPDELVAIKPVIEFDMVDKRFIEQSDILEEIESRPNLMDLTPTEFENLVSNLFQKLGLEAKLTRSHRDGGVDCIAFDNRPIFGGKVVIQAKRYSHTVGVSAVRDLFGTMQHEGANKGILVTTSGYGPDAFEFAKDKPIELMNGGQLLYELKQVGI